MKMKEVSSLSFMVYQVFLVAVVLLLSILGTLTVLSIGTQAANATKFYEVNQDLNALKMKSLENINHRTMAK